MSPGMFTTPIEHVVLLLMENRPFDMFYGFAQPVLKNKINGLTGNECFPTPGQGAGYRASEFDWWRNEEDDDDEEEVRRDTDDGGDEDDDDKDDDDKDDDDKEDDDKDDDRRKLRERHRRRLPQAEPLDGKVKIMYNTFVESSAPEDKFVSFAESDTPPGTTGALHWLRATYTAVSDAMPTRFEAISGTTGNNTYVLRNVWEAYCPGGKCPPSYTGYLCQVAETGGSYEFLHTSCSRDKALPLRVHRLTNGEYTLQTTGDEYVSFCDGGCSGGKWLAASYTSAAEAMTLKLTDPGVAPPPPAPRPPGKPACVENGAANYVCQHGGSWLGIPPLGWNSSWDGFNPICPGGLPELCPGGKCPKLCTNGLGNTPLHSECSFPLEYNGQSYDTCISPGTEGGYGWCAPKGYAPGGKYNGSWGGCKACDDAHFWDGCTAYPPTNHGGWMLSGMDPEAIHQFSPEQVPIHIKLAQEFALFDNWRTSFPGPSTPNHLFLMSATSAGCTSTGQDYQCTPGKK